MDTNKNEIFSHKTQKTTQLLAKETKKFGHFVPTKKQFFICREKSDQVAFFGDSEWAYFFVFLCTFCVFFVFFKLK